MKSDPHPLRETIHSELRGSRICDRRHKSFDRSANIDYRFNVNENAKQIISSQSVDGNDNNYNIAVYCIDYTIIMRIFKLNRETLLFHF